MYTHTHGSHTKFTMDAAHLHDFIIFNKRNGRSGRREHAYYCYYQRSLLFNIYKYIQRRFDNFKFGCTVCSYRTRNVRDCWRLEISFIHNKNASKLTRSNPFQIQINCPWTIWKFNHRVEWWLMIATKMRMATEVQTQKYMRTLVHSGCRWGREQRLVFSDSSGSETLNELQLVSILIAADGHLTDALNKSTSKNCRYKRSNRQLAKELYARSVPSWSFFSAP